MTYFDAAHPYAAPTQDWQEVCRESELLPGLGVCALVRGEQVALFSLAGHVYALGNHDPFTKANVISRGLTGSYARDGQTRLKVVSPLLKHAFDLQTGEHLGEERLKLPTYPVRVEGGAVWIGLAAPAS